MNRRPLHAPVRMPDWDRHIRAAQRRNRVIERSSVRMQIYILAAAAATFAFGHLADRVIAGWTACQMERLPQCPSHFKNSGPDRP